jgi:hypothetical protein
MKKVVLTSILIAGCMSYCFAQTDGTPVSTVKKDPQTDQYIGVQMNELIRQVFNFNNSPTTPIANPYLVTYNINSKKTGWGLRAGIGYNYTSTSNNDGITATTTKLNDLSLRVGIEKAFKLSDKWSAGAGLDFIYNTNNDNTTNSITSGDTSSTTTKTVISNYGGGPMGWLRYHVSPHVLIGTEASFYYVTGTQKNTIDQTSTSFDPNTGLPFRSTVETSSKPSISQGNFTVPVAFYLIVKF